MYICTENSFPIRRLQQLVTDQYVMRSDVPPSLISTLKFSDHVYVEHTADLVSAVGPPSLVQNSHSTDQGFTCRIPYRCVFLAASPSYWLGVWSGWWFWIRWQLCSGVSSRLLSGRRGPDRCSVCLPCCTVLARSSPQLSCASTR